MKNKKTIIYIVLSLLLGLILGGIGGAFYGIKEGTKLGIQMGDFSRWGGMANYATVVYGRYKEGTYIEAKAALIEFIDFWESFHGNEGEVFPENAYEWDTALAYGRLALLEKREGNIEQKNEYIKKAKERLKEVKKEKFTEEWFLKFIENIEKNG